MKNSESKSEVLWSHDAPGAIGNEEADRPSLTAYFPNAENASGAAVVVCPGGGYGHLAVGHEGADVAHWLNEQGVAAFVLRYRIAPRYRHPAPLLDAKRALRTVRARAREWKLDAKRIGIWGFSAGGHLASTLSTHFDDGDASSEDAIEHESSRPDFAILAYPVISFTEAFCHAGSRQNLLGEAPSAELAAALSTEQQVTPQTPPTFLFHTNSDAGVPPENSVAFYLALRKAGVPAEMHIYEQGAHGVGLAPNDKVLSSWSQRLRAWLEVRGIIGV